MQNEHQQSPGEHAEKTNRPAPPSGMPMEMAANPVMGSGMGQNFLPVSILVAAVMISGSILYAVNRTPSAAVPTPSGGNNVQAPDPTALLALGERDAILGDPNAPVTLIEYSDFQCPFCERLYSGTVPQIRDQYIKAGKVKMVYRHMAFLGPESVEAAEASECAKDQGKFWAFHDELFAAEGKDGTEHNGNLNRELFVKIANTIGLDAAAFATCYDSGEYASYVESEVAKARGGGVNATPTSFVNATPIQGAQPFEAFKSAIDAALAAN